MRNQRKRFSIYRQWLLILLLIFTTGAAAQTTENDADLDALKRAFVSFQYKKVVQLADSLLQKRAQLKTADLLEILRMKAIAYYVLDQNEMAALTFVQILKIKPDYQLDPLNNSPKIIRFFDKIKTNYLKEQAAKPVSPPASTPVQQKPAVSAKPLPQNRMIYESLLWPGLGQYRLGQKGKGGFLMSASFVTAATSAYLIWRTQVLEKRYLNAVDQADIDRKYADYDRSYRWRNATLIAYAVIWAYAQYDFSLQLSRTRKLTFHVQPVFPSNRQLALSLHCRF